MLEFQENFKNIDKINIILITNSKFSGVKEFPAKEILSKRVSFQLFDLTRYAEIANSRTGLEPITIDMEDYEGLSALFKDFGKTGVYDLFSFCSRWMVIQSL